MKILTDTDIGATDRKYPKMDKYDKGDAMAIAGPVARPETRRLNNRRKTINVWYKQK